MKFHSKAGHEPRIPVVLPVLTLLGIAYASFIPFEIRPRTLEQAWHIFRHMPYLDLGIESRADWVANLLLYIPFGVLLYAWLDSRRSPLQVKALLGLAVLGFGTALAIGIEFGQIFFAPRTVSLNDLLAESIGLALGIACWVIFKQVLLPRLSALNSKGEEALKSGLILYILVFAMVSLFPFDFLISFSELSWKWKSESGRLHTLMPGCSPSLRCLVMKAGEMAAAVPLGILFVLIWGRSLRFRIVAAALFGLCTALVVEGLQFFLASGETRLFSVLTKSLGVMLGAWIGFAGFNFTMERVTTPQAQRILKGLLVAYGVVLLKLNGWLDGEWLSRAQGLKGVSWEMFIPFYYHYFSSELTAMMSLIANAGLYAPFGAFVFLLGISRNEPRTSMKTGSVDCGGP